MKKLFTRFFRKILMLWCVGMIGLGSFATDLKPYAVYFPLADYPEFNYGNITDKWILEADLAKMDWYNNYLNDVAAANNTTYCSTAGFITAPSGNVVCIPYGRGVSLAMGYNRAMYMTFKTPYLNPGQYRVYMGVNYNGSNNRSQLVYNFKLDTAKFIAPADTTIRRMMYSSAGPVPTAPNKYSTKFTGSETRHDYDIYCGKVTVYEAGIHDFTFACTEGGESYVMSLLSFIPVTETDLDEDYAYPMFDMAGNVFFAADSLNEVNNTAVSGYYLPYQVADPTSYTTYSVVLDAGLYFANKQIVVKRADDQWTRLYAGTADATGKCTAQLPAGSYYVEVNKAVHTTTIEVTAAATVDIGVSTANINVSYSPENWYVGKSYQVYDATGTVLLWDLTIPATGIVPMFALPVDLDNAYIYNVVNDDLTIFEEGTISVPSTETINLDMTQSKHTVTINFGNDTYGQSQSFTIVRSTNSDALYVSGTSSATGSFTTQLPDGTYFITTASNLVFGTFTVNGADMAVDISARYSANICLGKTVAGANVDIYLSSTGIQLYSLTLDADGRVICSGLPNGRYYHDVYDGSGVITKKFTFVIEGADLQIGNCANLEQPYYKPYPVYFDVCNQPEITWMTSSGTYYYPGDLEYIKFDSIPVDTTYAVIDTTWTYGEDTTYVVNYDYNTIESITYYNWNCQYNFAGITYSKAADAFIWGDALYLRMPAKGKLTFVTPNLNPGRYNVYISNRWGGFPSRPTIDTTYMDGTPLLTDGQTRSFAGISTGDYTGGMTAAGLLRSINYAASGGSNQAALYMGEAYVAEPGRHELTLYSILGDNGGTVYQSSIWFNMIYFIPIDQDSAAVSTTGAVTLFYPRIDYAGNFVYASASDGNTTATTSLGTDGVNRARYPAQFEDSSILENGLVDYSKTLTINGGVYSAGDKLTAISPVDDWTIRQATADTITGIVELPLYSNAEPYDWAMWTEGVEGEVTMADNKTITIPLEINTYIASTYSITPNEADPELGTYYLNSTVTILDNLDFYYPITGVVLYDLGGQFLKEDGDTIYQADDKADNGIAPTYSTEIAISDEYLFISTYTGNGTRLKSAMNVAEYTKLKNIRLSAGIWPNPARESIQLKLNKNDGQAVYTIYNQLGQAVLKGSFSGTQATIGLGSIPKGLYLVKVAAAGSDMTTKLMVE